MLTNSTSNDYEKGMPAAHTLFQVKSLALIANARKVCISLHLGSWLLSVVMVPTHSSRVQIMGVN